jgi:hypothetical protein
MYRLLYELNESALGRYYLCWQSSYVAEAAAMRSSPCRTFVASTTQASLRQDNNVRHLSLPVRIDRKFCATNS